MSFVGSSDAVAVDNSKLLGTGSKIPTQAVSTRLLTARTPHLEPSLNKPASAVLDRDGAFWWTPSVSASATTTYMYDPRSWTPDSSTSQQAQLSENWKSQPLFEWTIQTSSPTRNLLYSTLAPQSEWSSSFWTSATAETWKQTPTISGINGSPETVVTKIPMASTRTIGVNISTTAASIITTFITVRPKAMQQWPASSDILESGVGWDAWTPGHRAGLVIAGLSGCMVAIGLLFMMWRMHRNRRPAHDDVGGVRKKGMILKKGLFNRTGGMADGRKGWRIWGSQSGSAGGSRREGSNNGDGPVTSTGVQTQRASTFNRGIAESSKTRSSIPTKRIDAVSSGLGGHASKETDELLYDSAVQGSGSNSAHNRSIHSHKSTNSSNPSESSISTEPPNLHSPINALEGATNIPNSPMPPSGRGCSFELFRPPELPNASRVIASIPSTIPVSDNSVSVTAYAHQPAVADLYRKSWALGRGVSLQVVHSHQELRRSKSNSARPGPARECEGSAQADTAPGENMKHGFVAVPTYGSLLERVAGKYPARWG